MPRVFIDQPLVAGSLVTLPSEAAHHLVQVLRLQRGEVLTLFNGRGGEYEARLESVSKREAGVLITRHVEVDRESPLHLTLAQCVSKGERMDYTLQKAVELGVTRVVPLLSQRSVVRLDAERWEKKLEHWRGVIVSACEQSGRTRLPELAPVAELSRWLDAPAPEGLKLTLAPDARQSLRDLAPDPTKPVLMLIGPEGGLADSEITQATRRRFIPLALGPRILRTETAGVAAIAAIQALWGDWR